MLFTVNSLGDIGVGIVDTHQVKLHISLDGILERHGHIIVSTRRVAHLVKQLTETQQRHLIKIGKTNVVNCTECIVTHSLVILSATHIVFANQSVGESAIFLIGRSFPDYFEHFFSHEVPFTLTEIYLTLTIFSIDRIGFDIFQLFARMLESGIQISLDIIIIRVKMT